MLRDGAIQSGRCAQHDFIQMVASMVLIGTCVATFSQSAKPPPGPRTGEQLGKLGMTPAGVIVISAATSLITFLVSGSS